ncbi:MAG: haloacid dehalogenase type II [Sutterellaceae bacterium]|nr:haloacid dehalogenase type II [Burkholderiaceae bacterium]MDW8429299.1 haloacid dehalogenase type II [Sutterellaceae bacterium]
MTVRAVLFDVFGTLLDVQARATRADQLFPGNGARLSRLWREKQLEYMYLRSLAGRYVPFTQLNEDALVYACEALQLPLDAAARGLLMHEYTQLPAFADVVPTLRRLQHMDLTVGVLSNGDPGLLEDVMHSAQLDEFIDVVLSADQVRAFKTAPAVYALGPDTLGCPPAAILFVSAKSWDAACATWHGYTTCWVNRCGAPLERLGVSPHIIGRTLEVAADFVYRQQQLA